MTTKNIKGNIFAILTIFLLVFVSGSIGNEFLNYKMQASIILGYALISLSFGAFVGMCFMIHETCQDITRLEEECFLCWDALQDEKMKTIHNLKDVHEKNIRFYEEEIAKYKQNRIKTQELNFTGGSNIELAYIDGQVHILEKLTVKEKSHLDQLLLS